jgi:hypothetical protein
MVLEALVFHTARETPTGTRIPLSRRPAGCPRPRVLCGRERAKVCELRFLTACGRSTSPRFLLARAVRQCKTHMIG